MDADADPAYDQHLTFGVNDFRSFSTIVKLLRADRQLRRCSGWIRWALDVTLIHTTFVISHPLRATIVSGQASTEIPNKIAFVSRSSLTTMVGFIVIAHCDRLLASVLEEGDTLGPSMRYRFVPFSLIIRSPVHCGRTYGHQNNYLLRFPLPPARLGKELRSPPQLFQQGLEGHLGVALTRCGVASGLPPH